MTRTQPDRRLRTRETSPWARAIPAALLLAVGFLALEHKTKHAGQKFQDVDAQTSLDEKAAGIQYQSIIRNTALAMMGLGGLWLIVDPRLRFWSLHMPLAGCGVAVLSWIFISAANADDAPYVVRRLVATACILSLAIGYARWLKPQELVRVAFLSTSVTIAIGMALDLAAGASPLQPDYRFSGTLHPNSQGVYCAILCLAGMCLMRRDSTTVAFGMAAACAFVLLLATKSRGSLLGIVPGVLAMWLVSRPRIVRAAAVAWLAAAVAVCVIVFACLDHSGWRALQNAILLGRTEDANSLTGRIPLWEELIEVYVPRRFWMGYGFGGFWNPSNVEELYETQSWVVPHAHNAFIDVMLQLGAIGLALAVATILCLVGTAMALYDRTKDWGYQFFVGLFAFAAFNSLIESAFILPTLYPTALALMCAASLALFRTDLADPRHARDVVLTERRRQFATS